MWVGRMYGYNEQVKICSPLNFLGLGLLLGLELYIALIPFTVLVLAHWRVNKDPLVVVQNRQCARPVVEGQVEEVDQ